MNMQAMLRQAQQMQKQMMAEQEKINNTTFSAENILAAVDYAITYMFGNIDTPKSLRDIVEIDENVLFSKVDVSVVEDSWD